MTAELIGGVCGTAVLFLTGLWLWRRRSNPHLQLAKAEEKLRSGRAQAAQRQFLRVVELVKLGKAKNAERNGLASRAHLALAGIEQSAGKRHEAVIHYLQARSLGVSLSKDAVHLLAECYAEKHEASEEACEAYLSYLSSGLKTGPAAERVYAHMQSLCQVTEEMKAAQRKPRGDLNRRVIAANPRLEWAHYFLGLVSLLDGRAAEAVDSFRRAQALNKDRSLTYYWLAVCYLQMPEPDLELPIEMIERFLSSPQGGAKTRKREAQLCSEIAKRLIQRIGGGNTWKDCSSDGRQSEVKRAIHYLLVAAEKQPEDAAHHYDLGRAYQLINSHPEAIAAFQRVVQLNPKKREYAQSLGLACWAHGRIPEAIDALTRAVEIDPGYGAAHGSLGEIYFEQNNYADAVVHLQIALSSKEMKNRWRAFLVRALHSEGRHDQLVEFVSALKPDDRPFDDDEEAAYAAGRSCSMLSRFDEAVHWLRSVAGRPDATYFLGCAHANIKNFAAAQECFDKLISSGCTLSSQAVLQRGHLLFVQGDVKGAEKDYRLAAGATPCSWEALYALGGLAIGRADFPEAVSHLSTAVTIQPENARLRFALALALELQGDEDNALQYYESVAPGSDAEAAAKLRVGVIRCRRGEFAEALRVLNVCAEGGNDGDTLLFYRGTAFAMAGLCEDAIREWERLRDRHPENDRLKLNLARARYLLGGQRLAQNQYRPAIEQWERYLTDYPMDDNMAGNLAELHFREALAVFKSGAANANSQARECLQAAVKRDPRNRTYRFFLALCDVFSGEDASGGILSLRSLLEEDRTPKNLYHLGLCLLQRGEDDEAVQLFKEVRSLPDAYGYRRYASWALANVFIGNAKYGEAAEILALDGTPTGDAMEGVPS